MSALCFDHFSSSGPSGTLEINSLGGYDSGHRAEAALAGLGFDEELFHNPLNSFSGGWQMRASMARVLLSEPDILLLDEPSNYLDIPAVEWLQRRLRGYTGTLLLISHDRFLLNSLTDVTPRRLSWRCRLWQVA